MDKKFVVFSVGKILEIISFILFIPLAISFFEIPLKKLPFCLFDHRFFGFLITIVATFAFGSALKLLGRSTIAGKGIREGFAIVTFGWIFATLFGAIPLFIHFLTEAGGVTPGQVYACFTDAVFEIMSGFTGTGATVVTNIEGLPRGILFWRSMTHWLGGMGIVTLVLAILPVFGIASYQMFKGEVPGPITDRLKPRMAQTAKILWGAYALLTGAEVLLLMFGGMPMFDAWCHAFGTMATGGFSTKTASIGFYASPYIEWVIIVFMFFAGMNFLIHYQVIFTGKFDFLKNNREFHFYGIVIVSAIIITTLVLHFNGIAGRGQIQRSFRHRPLSEAALDEKMAVERSRLDSFHDTVRSAAFQVTSLTTTTGYVTADFDTWPNFIRFTLVLLMFFGGCAGSTGGGLKMIRVLITMKVAWREVKTLVKPKLVAPIKIARQPVDEERVANIVGFVLLFLTCFVIFSAAMSFLINDFTTAVSSVVSTMSGIGPGLSGIGATENYAWIPPPGKWILIFCMLLGRLEIYTVIIAFAPISWKK
ncbi:MAG: TrkH family potassium uptake protein [Candidatus Omnitrophota bacterium]